MSPPSERPFVSNPDSKVGAMGGVKLGVKLDAHPDPRSEVWVCEERVGLGWRPIHRGAFLSEDGAQAAVREQSLFAPVGGLRVTRYVPA